MFEGLQKKWKVSGGRLALILCTFAIGGSATGFVGKKIMNALSIQQDWLWAVIYILLITINLAAGSINCQYSFRSIFFFYKIYRKIGAKIGSREESGDQSRESGAGRVLKVIMIYSY